MGGHGPAPKDPDKRRNRHAPQRGEWVDLPPLEQPVLPPASDVKADMALETIELWNAWRADPVTAQWSASDIAFAKRTIREIDGELIVTEDGTEIRRNRLAINEERLRLDGLGLTPKGKRDLRWRVPVGFTAGAARPEVAGPPDEPRARRLRAV